MSVRPVYLHGWPDGSIDTVTLAGHLEDLGLDALEISVDPSQGASLAEIVDLYVRQLPTDEDIVFIGYCGAGRYAMFISEVLTARGRPPVACLLVDSLHLHGSYALTQKFNRARPIPRSVKIRRQAERILPPYDERIRDIALEWLRVEVGLRSRLRRLLRREKLDREPPPDFTWMRPLAERLPPPFPQLAVIYNVERTQEESPFGPAGSMSPFFHGPVLTRSFESEGHRWIASDPEARTVAEAIVADVNAIVDGAPLHPHLRMTSPRTSSVS